MRINEITEAKMNYGTRFDSGGIASVRSTPDLSAGYGSYGTNSRGKGNTANSSVQGLATKARNEPDDFDVPYDVRRKPDPPTKGEIKAYCRQDPEYAELDDIVSAIYTGPGRQGVSRALGNRADRRAKLLKDLPFGPIKTIEPVKKKEKYDPMAFLKK